MADKIIQMQVRNEANTAWDNLNPKTKANAVLMENGKSVEESVSTHLADYTLQVPYAEATGTANTYSVTLNSAPTSLVAGLAIAVKIPVDSTGTSTLNVNGLGAKTIKKANGANVTNLKAGGIYTLRYDGVNFILQGEGASGNATASDLLSGKTATTDAGEIVGSMPNRGAINETITTQNGQIIIPEGYHNGSGIVKATFANLTPENIKNGVNIGDIIGALSSVEIDKIQHGEGYLDTEKQKNITISPIDISKSIVLLQPTGVYSSLTHGYPENYFIRGYLTSPTNLALSRYGNGGQSVYYMWSVITFSSGVNIQTGVSTERTGMLKFSSVNPTKSFIIASNELISSDQNPNNYIKYKLRLMISSSTQAKISSVEKTRFTWYLVEFI